MTESASPWNSSTRRGPDAQVAGSIPFYADSTAGVLDATTYMYQVLA